MGNWRVRIGDVITVWGLVAVLTASHLGILEAVAGDTSARNARYWQPKTVAVFCFCRGPK